MTPSLPTFSIASAMSLPISASPAEIDAVCSDLFLGLNFLCGGEQSLGHSLNSLLNAALEAQRVSASSHVAQALANQCLSQNGSGGGTVTCDVVSLLSNFLDQLSTDLLERLFELDLLGDGDAVVGDGGAPTSCLGQRCDPWGLGSP